MPLMPWQRQEGPDHDFSGFPVDVRCLALLKDITPARRAPVAAASTSQWFFAYTDSFRQGSLFAMLLQCPVPAQLALKCGSCVSNCDGWMNGQSDR